MVPWAHSNRQTKQHLEQFSCFCTAHSRASLYFTMGRPSVKIAPYHGDLDLPDLSHDSLGPSHSRFAQLTADSVCPCTLQWVAPFPSPPHNCRSHGECCPLSNTRFLGPTRVFNPNGISIGLAVFACSLL